MNFIVFSRTARAVLATLLLTAGLLPFLASATAATARTIELKLPSNRVGLAGFHPGKPNLPAVLILHGFLQTGEFSTITHMSDALASAGYTVLTPTLSLGISRRKVPLACEALHTHRMNDDISELGLWVEWLAKQGYPQIILAGHSFGSLQALAYTSQHPRGNIIKVIGVSLIDTDEGLSPSERKARIDDIKQRKARNDNRLLTLPLSYCNKFTASPDVFLSYLAWSRNTTLEALRKSKVPVIVIMGSKDDRMGKDWPSKLAASGAQLRLTEGANHFFDEQFEFDLQDAVVAAARSTGN